jgi:hypothetical protein
MAGKFSTSLRRELINLRVSVSDSLTSAI